MYRIQRLWKLLVFEQLERERVPYLSALEVCSRQLAIQIHVYLYLYLTITHNVIGHRILHMTLYCTEDIFKLFFYNWAPALRESDM